MRTQEEERVAKVFSRNLARWHAEHPNGIDPSERYICPGCGARKSNPISLRCQKCYGDSKRGVPNIYHPSVKPAPSLRPTVADFTDKLMIERRGYKRC